MIACANPNIGNHLALSLARYSRSILESLGFCAFVESSRPIVKEVGDAEDGEVLYRVDWLNADGEFDIIKSVCGIPATANAHLYVSQSE